MIVAESPPLILELNVDASKSVSVRRAVEKATNLVFDDEGWEYFMVEFQEELDVCTQEFAVERLVELIRGLRRSLPRPAASRPVVRESDKNEAIVIPTAAAPDWWVAHSRAVLEEHLDLQSQALSLFGFSTPITLEEADTLIRRELESQLEEGPPLIFDYLHFYQSGTERHRIISTAWAYPSHGLPSQPLFFLALYVLRLKRDTGCEDQEAVSFLLSGEQFVLPWIRVQTRMGSGVLDLRIATTAVPASEVLNAYRGAIAWQKTERPGAQKAGPRRRRPRQRTAELMAFIQNQQPGEKCPDAWMALRTEWNAKYPHWRFRTWTAMRENHRRAAKNANRP